MTTGEFVIQTHLSDHLTCFFADDLILFAEANTTQVQVIQNYLQKFCDLSGQWVSKHKTRIFFSKNISQSLATTLSKVSKNHGPWEISGVPLVHGRVTKSTNSYVVDSIEKRMFGWQASGLSLAGWCTLIQSITSIIPYYTIRSAKFPDGVCNQIEKVNRRFLWGSTDTEQKMSLVHYERIFQPKCCGGLGLKKMN